MTITNSASGSEPIRACDVMSAAEHVSDFKKNFICQNDMMHDALLNSPWPVLMYAFGVLFILFLVKRAADIPHRAAAQLNRKPKDNAAP